MLEGASVRFRARLRALMPTDWFGSVGARFKRTGEALADFSRQHIRPEERIREIPELTWNRVQGEANEKHAKALLNFAEEEAKKIANELARRVSDDKAREARASADKMEAEAGMARSNELLARILLLERLRDNRIVPMWDSRGNITFLKEPDNFDWQVLMNQFSSQQVLILPPHPQSDPSTGDRV